MTPRRRGRKPVPERFHPDKELFAVVFKLVAGHAVLHVNLKAPVEICKRKPAATLFRPSAIVGHKMALCMKAHEERF